MAKLSTFLAFLAVFLVTAVAIRPQKVIPSVTITKEEINERVNQVAETQVNIKRKVTLMSAQRDSDRDRIAALEEQLTTHGESTTVEELLRQSEARNQELTKMLSNFERFFGTLYAETPDAFDPTAAVDVRMSKLNSYLGNREAELLALRPAPPTIINDATVKQELLGNALYDMEVEMSIWNKKVRKFEERLAKIARNADRVANKPACAQSDDGVEEQEPEHPNVATKPTGSRTKRSISMDNNEIIDRLERMENLMVLQLQPVLNKTYGESSLRGLSSPSDILYNLTQLDEIEKEISALRATKPDSRKSAFSVARTTHMFGRSTPQIVEFDYVFMNKGGHFNEDNSTFICAVHGFYFVTFTARSFDGYTLGITLMKNTDFVTSIFTDQHEARNVMDSQSVIVPLEIGDTLWLRHSPSERYAVHSDRYRYTTFSAFLIYKGN